MQLEQAPDNLETDRRAFVELVAIFFLVCTNKIAFGFSPAMTDQLLEDTNNVIEHLSAEIFEREEAETIVLSSDDDSDEEESNMADVEDNTEDEADENNIVEL